MYIAAGSAYLFNPTCCHHRGSVPNNLDTIAGRIALALALVVTSPTAGQAQGDVPPANATIDRGLALLASARHYLETAVAPDGKAVAWVEELPGRNGQASAGTAIYMKRVVETGAPHRVTAATGLGPRTETDPAWSPDGSWIAFLSDAAHPGQSQLYVAPAAGGPARQLTHVTGLLASPAWSPDGRSIALLFTENSPRAGSGPMSAGAPQLGVIGEKVFEQRLTTVDVAAGAVHQLSPANLYVYEFDWSPDGRRFITTAAEGDGDDNWYLAQLYTVDAASGDTRSIYKPSTQIATPRWSPDGLQVAFIGGLMSDEPLVGGDVYVVSASGGAEARDVTPGMKAQASWVEWPTADRILFAETIDGGSGIASVGASGGEITTVWRGDETIADALGDFGSFSFSLARDGTASSVIRESFATPPEIWVGPIGHWKKVTHANDAIVAPWGEAKSLHWTNDQFTLQGWLIYPKGYDPSKKYPMVVWQHGGPMWASSPSWPASGFDNLMLMAADGYFVFYPNPRGSAGQGQEFARANIKDFGYGDLRDIEAGVDEIVRTLPVDASRVGITGWSYGGCMAMWAVVHSTHFRAAVAGAGDGNWFSYAGENGIDKWMLSYFGASVYDDPAPYARVSAMTYIKNAKTPTLLLVGERDLESPSPQSFEFYRGLKYFGVKTQLVVYPGEGHHIAQPAHQRDVFLRMIDWFDANMPAGQ
jgi:dipeptidyl aminopeptidase/acylaminoacyl peptidase